jgi:hypothetical protein
VKRDPIDPEPAVEDAGAKDMDESEDKDVVTDSHLVETDAGT